MQKNFVLKAKNAIKRIAAISASSVMLGATMAGGVAAVDLGDYPSPFIAADGTLNGLVVVGADAASADVVGATELVSTLTQAAVTTTGTGTTTTVTGGKSKDINLGDSLATDFSTTGLDDDDLSGFQDTTIDFNDSTYNVHDALYLAINGSGSLDPAAMNVSTSLTASDDDYESNIAIEVRKKAIKYFYMFDEPVALDTANTDTPVEINFLGRIIKITKVSDHNTFTAQVGTEYFLNVGDSVTVDGKVVTLNDVSSSATCTVSVSVDGVQEVVTTSAETVNGIKVEADECFYTDTKEQRSASIIVGEHTSKTYNDGDAFIDEDTDDPDWVWYLGNLDNTTQTSGVNKAQRSGSGPVLGITNDFVRDDWDDGPIQVGESYCLPWNYACIKFDSLTSNAYVDITLDVDTAIDLNSSKNTGALVFGTSEDGVVISANKESSLVLDFSAAGWATKGPGFTADASTDTIYIINQSTKNAGSTADNQGLGAEVFYVDDNNDIQYAGNVTWNGSGLPTQMADFAFVDYKDTTEAGDIEIGMNYNNATSHLIISFQDEQSANTRGLDILTNWSTTNNALSHLGSTADTAEAGELIYDSTGSSITSLGTKDEDHRTHYGIIIYDPKSNGASDKVKLSIPGDTLEATVIITSTGTTTTTTGGTVTVVSVAGTDVAKLDTEVSSPSAQNLILVGGPAVNRLTAQALGLSYPTYGEASTIPRDKGLIKLVSNAFGGTNVALVVAGWEAGNTRDAADVLKKYADYSAQLTGQSAVEVVGTTVTAVGTTTAVE